MYNIVVKKSTLVKYVQFQKWLVCAMKETAYMMFIAKYVFVNPKDYAFWGK